jgi:hypothetical protein
MGARRSVRVLTTVALSIAAGAPASAKPRPPASDHTPPSQPTDLHDTEVTQTSVTLAWNPSTDNVGVRSYSLWHEGAQRSRVRCSPADHRHVVVTPSRSDPDVQGDRVRRDVQRVDDE